LLRCAPCWYHEPSLSLFQTRDSGKSDPPLPTIALKFFLFLRPDPVDGLFILANPPAPSFPNDEVGERGSEPFSSRGCNGAFPPFFSLFLKVTADSPPFSEQCRRKVLFSDSMHSQAYTVERALQFFLPVSDLVDLRNPLLFFSHFLSRWRE